MVIKLRLSYKFDSLQRSLNVDITQYTEYMLLLLDFRFNITDFADFNQRKIEENKTLRAPTDVPKLKCSDV